MPPSLTALMERWPIIRSLYLKLWAIVALQQTRQQKHMSSAFLTSLKRHESQELIVSSTAAMKSTWRRYHYHRDSLPSYCSCHGHRRIR